MYPYNTLFLYLPSIKIQLNLTNKMSRPKLSNGVYTANLTPLNKDLTINYKLLVKHCKWLLKNGSTGLALLGTTGEANSFSIKERKQIVEKTIAGGIPAKKLMVGTGCCSLPETVSLTKHAIKHGAAGVLVLPPFYYKQVTQQGIFNYFDALIQKVNDKRLRIYLYHIPKMSGLAFSLPLIQQLHTKYPKTIVGIKDSNGDFSNMKAMVKQFPDFQVFAGTEKYLLDILKIGGAGCISATCNVTSPFAGEVFKIWKAKKSAKKQNEYLVKVRTSFEGFPFSGALKTYMAEISNNPKWLPVRPPNEPLSMEDKEKLEDRLAQLKFKIV